MIIFENVQQKHYQQISQIYEEGIKTGNATFQSSASSWEEWDKSHFQHSRIVALLGSEIVGWAALSPVSSRCVYGGVAEVSIYVAAKARGNGVGEALLNELILQSEQQGIWMLQSGIFPENIASIKIHEKCGFRIVGFREKIGKMNNIWRDNLLLEKRSQIVGI
jgi:phosphinothricin acetyltransferase